MALVAHPLADVGRTPVLPDDRAARGAQGLAVPQQHRLALVGDADAGEVGLAAVPVGEAVAGRLEGGLPDLLRGVLDPAGLGEVLAELLVAPGGDGPVRGHHERRHARRTCVDGEDAHAASCAHGGATEPRVGWTRAGSRLDVNVPIRPPDQRRESHARRSAHRWRRLPRTERRDPGRRPQGRQGVRLRVRRLPRRLEGPAGGHRPASWASPQVRGILPRGGTILGSSRTNPFKIEGGVEQIKKNLADHGVDALVAIGGEDTLGVATKLHDLGVNVVGVPKTIDNDLNAHRLHLRLRHRGQHRDGGDRPAAHHRRVAPPRARRRGDGPARRLDRAARRARRRRQRRPDPGAAVRHRPGLRPGRAALREPLLADPRGLRGRRAHRGRRHDPGLGGEGRLRPRPPRRHRRPARAARSSSAPARRPARSSSATSSAAARRPRSTGGWPPGSACTPSTRSTRATSAR